MMPPSPSFGAVSAAYPLPSPQKSATARMAQTEATLALQIQQFLDDWHYRMVHSGLAKKWDRKRVMSTAVDLLELSGVPFQPGIKEVLLDMEDDMLVKYLLQAMPAAVKDNFEQISLQLQMAVHSVSKIRHALDRDDDRRLEEVCDEADELGVVQCVLRNTVVHAVSHASKVRRCHATWANNTQMRLQRLMQANEQAEQATQQLLAVEAELRDFDGLQSRRAKKVLLGLAAGNERAALRANFSAWSGIAQRAKADDKAREQFEAQLEGLQRRIVACKEQRLRGVRGALGRKLAEDGWSLLSWAVSAWRAEFEERKREGETAEKLREVQERLAKLQEKQACDARKVLIRMSEGSNDAILTMCLQSWIGFSRDYKLDKEMQDAVKAAEAKVKAQLASKKDDSKRVLDTMAAASNNGLLSVTIGAWHQAISEGRKVRELEDKLTQTNSALTQLNQRQGTTARNVQGRINEHLAALLELRCFSSWVLSTKVARVSMHFSRKMDQKRTQLSGVQTLFKTFAQQLEQGLDVTDEADRWDTTARGQEAAQPSTAPRASPEPAKQHRSHRHRHRDARGDPRDHRERERGHESHNPMSRSHEGPYAERGLQRGYEGGVSLPDIHRRGVMA